MTNLYDNVTDCVAMAGLALEKSDCLLNYLTNEYAFSNQPTRFASNLNEEAKKWLWEYHTIIIFILILQDCVFEATEHLAHAEALNKGGASNG